MVSASLAGKLGRRPCWEGRGRWGHASWGFQVVLARGRRAGECRGGGVRALRAGRHREVWLRPCGQTRGRASLQQLREGRNGLCGPCARQVRGSPGGRVWVSWTRRQRAPGTGRFLSLAGTQLWGGPPTAEGGALVTWESAGAVAGFPRRAWQRLGKENTRLTTRLPPPLRRGSRVAPSGGRPGPRVSVWALRPSVPGRARHPAPGRPEQGRRSPKRERAVSPSLPAPRG